MDDSRSKSKWSPNAVVLKAVDDRSTCGQHEFVAPALWLNILGVCLLAHVRAPPPARDESVRCHQSTCVIECGVQVGQRGVEPGPVRTIDIVCRFE